MAKLLYSFLKQNQNSSQKEILLNGDGALDLVGTVIYMVLAYVYTVQVWADITYLLRHFMLGFSCLWQDATQLLPNAISDCTSIRIIEHKVNTPFQFENEKVFKCSLLCGLM